MTALKDLAAEASAPDLHTGPADPASPSGDLILGINGKRLADAASLRRAVLDLRGRARARIVVVRGRGRYHVTIPLG